MLLKTGSSLILVMFAYFCHAQDPAMCPEECSACAGGMISITLRFDGTATSKVTVEDNKTVIFEQQVAPSEMIVLVPQGLTVFVGNTLGIKVNDVLNTTLNTKCNIPIFINAVYGDFTIFAGESKTGGSICCIPTPWDPNNPPGEEIEFKVGEVVTPNGDGTNDVWVLFNVEMFLENKVTIVDRWGSIVFSASGYDNRTVAWGGETQRGGNAPTGTYFYTFRGVAGTLVFEKQGSIELIR